MICGRVQTPVLEVQGLSRGDAFADVSFALYEGEILGIAGMLGAGRTELLRALFGADACDRGQIAVQGQRIERADPPENEGAGLGLYP